MHEFLWLDDSLVRTEPEAVSSARLYGKGVFTTLAVHDSKPVLFSAHWKRLKENAARLRIDLSKYREEIVLNALSETIEKNRVSSGRARITFFDETRSAVWLDEGNVQAKVSLSIITGDPRQARTSLKLTVSSIRVNTTSPLAGVKSCNYLEPLLALDAARADGFDEAVRLNERDEIVSTCMANVFWLKDEKLFTPSLKTGCLAGTTREYILKSQDCMEVETDIDSVREAEAIFLTSAGIGIASVAEFEGRKMPNSSHPITKILPF